MTRTRRTGWLWALPAVMLVETMSASPLAQSVVIGWSAKDGQAIVARGGANPTIRAFRADGQELSWSVEGPAEPSALVISGSGTDAVVLDALRNQAFIVSTEDGSTRRLTTAPGPIAAIFLNDDLFVLCREGRELQSFSKDGAARSLPIAADTTFLRAGQGRIFLYSRLEGTITEVDPETLTVIRTAFFAGAASDFEIDDRYGYLTLPSRGTVLVFTLDELRESESLSVGAVPMDLAVASEGRLLDGGTLAIADPSSKRIWMSERSQSGAVAFGRGFLRGFLGLGLYVPKSSEYPTGVDRVWAAMWGLAAYDSSSGSLYLVSRGKVNEIGRGVPPGAIALTDRGVAFWDVETDRLELVRNR